MAVANHERVSLGAPYKKNKMACRMKNNRVGQM